ncbi:MAG: peptidoglycan DD-metalloendopeptidase family protein [Gammaproteobacteria bacterium]|nr:peptidoglycan DD-metalloendopeptidase family protein [Gammaproteobacteria bacterium]
MMFRQSCLFPATLFTVILVACSLAACSSNGKQWDPDDYTVKSGDTLYSIAWRYELDPEEFSAWNGMRTSKFIKPGQRLHTRKPANFDQNRKNNLEQSIAYAPASTKRRVSVATNQKWVKAEKGDTLYGLSKQYGVSVDRLAQLNQLKKPYIIKPGQTIFLKPLNTGSQSSNTTTKSSKKNGSRTTSSKTQYTQSQAQAVSWPKTVRWQRPANGKIVKKFSRNRNDAKGIDIAGKKGNAIVASADGKVVYSGNGLISYGNLIIIKHNKTFLSAYAYNRKLLVKEGSIVKAGQQIAEMGSKDKSNARLHFEIRKNGKPVDPLKYLPW